jgi:hypothetical protein
MLAQPTAAFFIEILNEIALRADASKLEPRKAIRPDVSKPREMSRYSILALGFRSLMAAAARDRVSTISSIWSEMALAGTCDELRARFANAVPKPLA